MRARRIAIVVLAASLAATACGASETPSTGARRATVDDVVRATASSARVADATVLSAPTAMDATVHVPDAALPAGVTGDQITAEVYAFDATDRGGGTGVLFHLGPDGTRFRSPVTLAWDGPLVPDADVALVATDDAGEPSGDDLAGPVGSVGALRTTPTGNGRAHYELPIEHFSSWMVTLTTSVQSGSDSSFVVSGSFPDELVVGSPTSTDLLLLGASMLETGVCLHAFTVATSGPIEADAPRGARCSADRETVKQLTVPVSLACTGPGSAKVSGAATALIGFNIERPTSRDDIPTEAELRRALVETASQIADWTAAGTTDVEFGRVAGVLVTKRYSFTIRCVEPTTTTIAVPAVVFTTPSTTRPARTTTTLATAVVVPLGPDQTRPPTAGPSLPSSVPVVPSPPTPTSPPSTIPPDTTVPPETTAPPTTAMPTTAPPTTPPTTAPAVWGPAGTWAYNETGSCDWNGSGGCGWYYGAQVGTYVMGPMGSPGSTR